MVASDPSGESPSVGDPWFPILAVISAGLARTLTGLGASASESSVVAVLDTDGGPEGDVAFPCHRFAAALGRRPDELAAEISANFPPHEWLAAVGSKGAYVNFSAEPKHLVATTLGAALSRRERWGSGPAAEGAASVEHTSANPTGPFHIGQVRNAIIGDTFARILRAAGTPVTTQYYVDDMGRQSATITWIWSKPAPSGPTRSAPRSRARKCPGKSRTTTEVGRTPP